MSQIIPLNSFIGNKKQKEINKLNSNFNNTLLISDLDSFFRNIYEYYYNRGYCNILIGIILDNISYLFSIHFTIFNLYFLKWSKIIELCVKEDKCSIELTEYINFEFIENSCLSFILFYGLLMLYYVLFLYKSCLFLYKMKRMKNIYNHKLHIKQKEMENMKFDEILEKIIQLQKNENFCRVKENLTKYDIIARILRKENYLIALISNKVVDFSLKIPFIGKKNFFSNYLNNNLSECILNFAFIKGEVNINIKFYNLRYLQMKMFIFMIFEIIFLAPVIFFKVIFWIFKNADNIKLNKNINDKIWSNYIQIIFKNYNELQHHFENRINNSYTDVEKFMNCFKDRKISILRKFITITCGSFLVLIFIISSIDDRLLTDLKVFGKKFVWLTFIIGLVLSIFSSTQSSKSEEYLENVNLKEDLLKNYVNNIINVPYEFRQKQNYSSIFKIVSQYYEYGVVSLIKEIISIILFPFFWIRLIFNAQDIIKNFKSYSKSVDGLGTIYSYSYMDLNNFKCLKEKDYNITEATLNDRKFINSFLNYNFNFNSSAMIQKLFTHNSENNDNDDFEIYYNQYDEEMDVQFTKLEALLFEQFKKENYKKSGIEKINLKSYFREYIFYHISLINTNEILCLLKYNELRLNSINDDV